MTVRRPGRCSLACARYVMADKAYDSPEILEFITTQGATPVIPPRAGHHSIRINTQWRLCFRWEADGPYDVEIVDYH